ncbi:MAG TPA: hypothetical protein ENI33_08980 [Thermoplasmatales archaeon]|nr:hypothetical protein [Thermoplasmatales archaeon]
MKKAIIIAFMLLLQIFIPVHGVEEKEIKVAIYFSNVKRFAEEVKEVIDYSWVKNGIKYTIKPDIITKRDVLNGKIFSYDVFLIPGSGRHYFDAFNKKWRSNIIKFVENGGGYVGICGGANLASMGFSNKSYELIPLLKIANVYVNDEQYEEWQYLWKSNWRHGGAPIKIKIVENDVPIFEGFYEENRSIRYWGGPGMYDAYGKDGKMGEIIPLALYAEEPMEVAPLHYWRWKDGGWYPYKNVTTDIKGEYAAIATQYGNGKIVLFGPHPERKTFFDGHVEEFPVREDMAPFTWFIYNWVSNNSSVISYNWWMLRRSVAWCAGIGKDDMPYASEIAVYIEKPRYGIYFNGRKIIYNQNNVVIGNFNLEGEVIEAERAFLYIDGEFINEIDEEINLNLNLPSGKHLIRIIAENKMEKAGNEMEIISLNM